MENIRSVDLHLGAFEMLSGIPRCRKLMKYRRPLKITQRTTSITNSFVQAVIPWVQPSAEERREALSALGMSDDDLRCAYCSGSPSDWDHLRPLVRDKRPTGYISDYRNLVPSCGRCNQSKGASEWRSWLHGNAPGSPRRRGIIDVSREAEALERFEVWGSVVPLDIEALVPASLWNEHWVNHETVVAAL